MINYLETTRVQYLLHYQHLDKSLFWGKKVFFPLTYFTKLQNHFVSSITHRHFCVRVEE